MESTKVKEIIGRSYWVAILVSILVFILPFVFEYWGCASSNWRCSGDNMGGVMMIYALVVMIPSVFIGIACFIFLLKEIITKHKVLAKSHLIGIFMYSLIFLASAYELGINDMEYFESLIKY